MEPVTSRGLVVNPILESAAPDNIRDDEFVGNIDPKLIDVHWAHARHESTFSSAGYERLKESIFQCGRNEVPVLLHSNSVSGRFILVYGRCRLQAASELGFRLTSVVRTSYVGTDEQSTVRTMAAESEWGTPWSLYERGTLLQRSLERGLFPSRRHAANFLGWDQTIVGKALVVAEWPQEVISAFCTPSDIKGRWISPLKKALERDPARVVSIAAQFASFGRERRNASAVFKALTSGT